MDIPTQNFARLNLIDGSGPRRQRSRPNPPPKLKLPKDMRKAGKLNECYKVDQPRTPVTNKHEYTPFPNVKLYVEGRNKDEKATLRAMLSILDSIPGIEDFKEKLRNLPPGNEIYIIPDKDAPSCFSFAVPTRIPGQRPTDADIAQAAHDGTLAVDRRGDYVPNRGASAIVVMNTDMHLEYGKPKISTSGELKQKAYFDLIDDDTDIRDDAATLFHEMLHGYNIATGTRRDGEAEEDKVIGINKPVTDKSWSENRIRYQLQLENERVTHNPKKVIVDDDFDISNSAKKQQKFAQQAIKEYC